MHLFVSAQTSENQALHEKLSQWNAAFSCFQLPVSSSWKDVQQNFYSVSEMLLENVKNFLAGISFLSYIFSSSGSIKESTLWSVLLFPDLWSASLKFHFYSDYMPWRGTSLAAGTPVHFLQL